MKRGDRVRGLFVYRVATSQKGSSACKLASIKREREINRCLNNKLKRDMGVTRHLTIQRVKTDFDPFASADKV